MSRVPELVISFSYPAETSRRSSSQTFPEHNTTRDSIKGSSAAVLGSPYDNDPVVVPPVLPDHRRPGRPHARPDNRPCWTWRASRRARCRSVPNLQRWRRWWTGQGAPSSARGAGTTSPSTSSRDLPLVMAAPPFVPPHRLTTPWGFRLDALRLRVRIDFQAMQDFALSARAAFDSSLLDIGAR